MCESQGHVINAIRAAFEVGIRLHVTNVFYVAAHLSLEWLINFRGN